MLLLHLGLLWHFAPPRVIFSRSPLYPVDYSLHFYQVDRALKAWRGWSRLWGYDPHVLAGQPVGAIEDLSSKTLELWVIGLDGLGVHPALAFNLYVLLVHLLFPLVGLLAARLLGLRAREAVLATSLWVLLYFFDSFLHWSWFCGMISWTATSFLSVLFVIVVYRAVEGDRLRPWVGVAGLAALLAALHPFAAVVVLAPCAAIYLRRVRQLRPLAHVALGLSLVGAVAAAMIWLPPAWRFRHYILDTTSFLKPTLSFVITDFFDILADLLETGYPVRTMLRTLCFVAAGICLWRWRAAGDRRVLPFAVLLGTSLALCYLGGYVWVLRQAQPYRNMAPATLAAALLAAALLAELLAPARLRGLPAAAKLLLLLALVVIVPRAGRTVLFFFPDTLPRQRNLAPQPEGVPQRKIPPHHMLYERRPMDMRHGAVPTDAHRVRRWLIEHRAPGRVVVQNYELGEFLAWSTELPILGGFVTRNIPHVDAHLFRRYREDRMDKKRLAGYLKRYGVRFVVMTVIDRRVEWRKDLLRFRKLVAGHRIYEVRQPSGYFLRGSGRVAAQQLNRIVVRDAAGDDVVLRFHWLETLRCRPGCTVERFALDDDRVGFIRVRNPPRDFEIYNGY